jgi:hypothetical protein
MDFNSAFKRLTNVNKYLHNDTREKEVNINISVNKKSEEFYKKRKVHKLRLTVS